MKQSKQVLIITSALFIILISSAVSAQLGQSAGPLNFGEIPRGGKQTLSYGVINNGDSPLEINAEFLGDIEKIATVKPKTAIVPPKSYIPVFVTIQIPLNAEPGKKYSGHVFVKQGSGGSGGSIGGGGGKVTGGLSFNTAVVKSIEVSAGEAIAPPQKPELPKPPEPPYFIIFILSIMGLLFLYRDPFGWRTAKKVRKKR